MAILTILVKIHETSRKGQNISNIQQISSDTWHKTFNIWLFSQNNRFQKMENPTPKENVGLRKQKQDNTDIYLTP